MFNGIIRNIGVIKSIKSENQSMILGIHSNMKVNNMMIGSSISL